MYLVPSCVQKIILTQDEFSKLIKTQKQKQTNLVIPAEPPLCIKPEVNTQLSLSGIEIDLNKSRCNSTTLQYNQVKTIIL